ncbi:glycosyltransferase family 2 protein [Aliiroseovarius crassostreae]|nr:glycosyltransferase family 2 protein [Aliiroseovarius crassostreae]
MKNEAPYILEWVAYHRAMGIDKFLIYTNDCSDGTSEILDRLQDLGILQHRTMTIGRATPPAIRAEPVAEGKRDPKRGMGHSY